MFAAVMIIYLLKRMCNNFRDHSVEVRGEWHHEAPAGPAGSGLLVLSL